MKFGRLDQTQVPCLTPPSTPVTNHFPTACTFLKGDLFGEHKPPMTALVVRCNNGTDNANNLVSILLQSFSEKWVNYE